MSKSLEAFFDKLYLENYDGLFKYAYRLTYEKNMAEEIVQDTFLVAYKKIEVLHKHENPIGWLYVTVKNITKTHMREYLKIKKCFSLEEHEIAVRDEESEELLLLNYLNEDETNIMIKFYIEKKSLDEISKEYGISLPASKMRLKRARDKFKYRYEKEK